MEDLVRIPLTRRSGEICGYTVVDAVDAEWASQWHWRLNDQGYAMRYIECDGRYVKVYLHRELLGLARGDSPFGDHIDRDRLNNRRANLRAVSRAANSQNRSPDADSTSAYRGVSWDTGTRKWRAQVRVNGHRHHLGLFDDEVAAARAAQAFRAEMMPYSTEVPIGVGYCPAATPGYAGRSRMLPLDAATAVTLADIADAR